VPPPSAGEALVRGGAEFSLIGFSLIPFLAFIGWAIVTIKTGFNRYWLYTILYAIPMVFFGIATEMTAARIRDAAEQGRLCEFTTPPLPSGTSTTDRPRRATEPPDWAVVPGVLAWIVGIVHAFKARPEVKLRMKYVAARAVSGPPLPTAWRYWAFVPYFAWAAWLHAAIRSRHWVYYLFAVIYAAPFVLAMSSRGPRPPESVTTVGVLSWIVGIIHTMMWSKVVGARIQQQKGGGSAWCDLEHRIKREYLAPSYVEPIPEVSPAHASTTQGAPRAQQTPAPAHETTPARKERTGIWRWLPTREELLRNYIKELVMSLIGGGLMLAYQMLKKLWE
jgi:hypothetical protein